MVFFYFNNMTKLWLSSILYKHNPLSWLFQNLIYRFFHGLMLLLKPVIPVFILPYSSPMTCSIVWFYCLLGFGYVVTMTLKNRYWRRLFLPVSPFWSANVILVYYHPRPFVMEVGRTLIYHAPNGSFSSDHMLIFSSIAFSYLFSAQRKLGIFLLIMAWLVAWSRVYLGVHFPLDMLGAFLMAFALNFFGLKLWNLYKEKIMQWALTIHFYLFKPLIQKGYIK